MKKLTELSDKDALVIFEIIGGPTISKEAKIFQVKDLLTTNKFYTTQTNITGNGWYKIFEFLRKNGYQIES